MDLDEYETRKYTLYKFMLNKYSIDLRNLKRQKCKGTFNVLRKNEDIQKIKKSIKKYRKQTKQIENSVFGQRFFL